MKSFKLDNGIRGVILPLPGLNSVTIEVFVKIGSKYEQRNEFGLSHFLEHMAFKGTIKRPTAMMINNEIDAKGASYNAGTGQEMTSYYITTVSEHIPWAIELLSDIILNSVFSQEETVKERGVIIEGIKMYQDNPMMGMGSEFTKFLYGGSSIGCWNISGEVEDIKRVEREIIVNYRNKYLNPKEMVVVLCGDVTEEAEVLVKEAFETLKGQSLVLPEVRLILNKEKNKVIKKEVEQGHFCMGLPAIGWPDKRKYALKLLDLILDGNSSSRLYEKIREERALAYYVHSVGELFCEGGYWAVQSGVSLEKMDQAMEVVRQEIVKIADSITEEELQMAKDYILGKTKLAMDKTGFVSGFFGQNLLLEGRLDGLDEELDKYKKIGLSEVKELAKEIFKQEEIRTLVCTNR